MSDENVDDFDDFDEDVEVEAALSRTTEDGPGTDDLDSLPESDADFDAEEDVL